MEEDQGRVLSEGGAVSRDAVDRLRALLGTTRVAMLTTSEQGALHSRPMQTQVITENGEAWFFTDIQSQKVGDLERDQKVNLIYHRPMRGLYVSVGGRAHVVTDRQKMRELWHPMLLAWFPEGLDDPNLALVRVDMDRAEVWDAPYSNLSQIARVAGTLLGNPTQRAPEVGRQTLVLRPGEAEDRMEAPPRMERITKAEGRAGTAPRRGAETPSARTGGRAGKAEVGKAEAGRAEAGRAEAGRAEVGRAEAGKAEVRPGRAEAKGGKAEARAGRTEAKGGKAEAKAGKADTTAETTADKRSEPSGKRTPSRRTGRAAQSPVLAETPEPVVQAALQAGKPMEEPGKGPPPERPRARRGAAEAKVTSPKEKEPRPKRR